jgi:hypothetical protein
MKIFENQIQGDDVEVYGKYVKDDIENRGYNIGDLLNMPYLWGLWQSNPHHDQQKLDRYYNIAKNYKDSILSFYQEGRCDDEQIPNIPRIISAVNKYTNINKEKYNDLLNTVQKNDVLCVHIRCGDVDTYKVIVNSAVNLSNQFNETYIFSGLHLDTHFCKEVDKINNFVNQINVMLRQCKNAKFIQGSPDEHLSLISHANNLFVSRGGFSALCAIVCRGNVYSTYMFNHKDTINWKINVKNKKINLITENY